MNNFDYILRFDDEQHSLNARNGIPLSELTDLLQSLHRTLHLAQDETIVLSQVIGNSYAVQVTTNSHTVQRRMLNLHQRISHGEFVGMNLDERKYAKELRKVIKDRYFVQGYDPKDTDKRVQINTITIPKEVEYYHEISTIYGIITAIGGRSLNGKASIHISDALYDITVTSEQEKELIKSFKTDRLALTVRQKIHCETGDVKQASLEDFEVLSNRTFVQAADELRQKYPDGIFPLLVNVD
jgi:transcriptional regulator CtsR